MRKATKLDEFKIQKGRVTQREELESLHTIRRSRNLQILTQQKSIHPPNI
jgi:hypothetical protein